MPVRRLKELLDEHNVKYISIIHSPAYTAQEIAALTHIKGKELAKTVVVKADGETVMVVLPATFRIDLYLLMEALEAERVELATEDEFRGLFPHCEVGAMPPFGNLYDMKVFVAEELAEDEEIAFNAGTHTELLRLAYRDFALLVQPEVVEISVVSIAV